MDGELVVWDTAGRLSFEALQRRAAARGRTATALAAKTPAFFIAFDALQIDGTELLALPYSECRRRLEVLFAARALTSPWTLCPMTTDPSTAQQWWDDWSDISGSEGLVVKALNQRYRPGSRSRAWTKIRRRNSTEAIIGAITGTLSRPQLLILGRHDATGRLRPVGRTVPLRPNASRMLAEHLPRPAPDIPGPERSSPRPGAPATSSTPPSSNRTSSRRSTPTPPSTAAASTATRSGTYACAWTRPLLTYPASAWGRPPLRDEHAAAPPRENCSAPGCSLPYPNHQVSSPTVSAKKPGELSSGGPASEGPDQLRRLQTSALERPDQLR
ncbi:ATP-dependent DNA ligase [Streptomyces vinaceus]|uniref:ATP-dependent DNA ligase n=1 Tax=Streptomyces vinaceus TaxID=1960 RepID=UPI0037F4CF1D